MCKSGLNVRWWKGRANEFKFFSLILDSSVGLSAGIQCAGDLVPETLVRILHSTEEDNLSPFYPNIAYLCRSFEINNKHMCMYACMHMCKSKCRLLWIVMNLWSLNFAIHFGQR